MNTTTLIYQGEDGSLHLPVTMDHRTVWLSQAQMVTLFGRDKSVMTIFQMIS